MGESHQKKDLKVAILGSGKHPAPSLPTYLTLGNLLRHHS